MSADSPRRQSKGIPAIVPPQIVCDRSIIDNVAGFINDVTLTGQPQVDQEDTIMWARFETTADISDPTYGDDLESAGDSSPLLLLILGYGLGVQVWAIPNSGEAVEVLSWRHGHVSALRILPTPMSSNIEMTNEPIDQFADKRPIIAICDDSPAGSGSQFSSVNFISLKDATQIKAIKFKNSVLDILANRTSIVITFPERIAVFDARNFEDRLTVSSCYPSPGINPNPVSLGSRWLAYSENKLIHSKKSGGGCDGDGVSSYTATVLNAAKSLSKGLRELGEQVAAGLTGSSSSGSFSKTTSFDSAIGDVKQPGVVTVLDIKHPIKDISPTAGSPVSMIGTDPFVVHFVAHLEAIVALEFDSSGMLLLTADKRGHDFHIFRIQPHPTGSQLGAVHHLYVLHRGDTSAKVQNIAFSIDSRWVAVSTLRGTTHVFPINPYGGPVGIRTHASLHVVNRLSRFHRSAGLSVDGRSNSPIFHPDNMTFNQIYMPYNNPTMSPFPRPHIVLPLAQLRQPSALGSPPNTTQNSYVKSSHGRQRLSSLSDDSGKPLSVCAIFAKQRSWLLDSPNLTRETLTHKMQRKAVDSLFIMAGHGALIQYDLDIKLSSNVAKEKICDDTPIELEVEAKAQWNLYRKESSVDIQPPLASDNWLLKERGSISCSESGSISDEEDRWLSQVEIVTHAGPHRRLWMGPQCVFKTYNTPSGAPLSHIDIEAIEIGTNSCNRPGPSSPMDMTMTSNVERSSVPVLIESGSYSSIEQSPKLMDRFRHEHMDSDYVLTHGESRLKEDLADAMRESPSVCHKETGLTPVITRKTSIISLSDRSSATTTNNKGCSKDSKAEQQCLEDITEIIPKISVSPSLSSSSLNIKKYNFEQQFPQSEVLIEKVVNPLGTVTTRTRSSNKNELDTNSSYSNVNDVIHENCDEALFRPVVTVFCDNNENDKKKTYSKHFIFDSNNEYYSKLPETIGTKLVVPVIEKIENKRKSDASAGIKRSTLDQKTIVVDKSCELSFTNKNNKPGSVVTKKLVENKKTQCTKAEEETSSVPQIRKSKVSKTYLEKQDDEIIAKVEDQQQMKYTKRMKEEEIKINVLKAEKAQSLEKLNKTGSSQTNLDAGKSKNGNHLLVCSISHKLSNISRENDKNNIYELPNIASDLKFKKTSNDVSTPLEIKPLTSEKLLKSIKKQKVNENKSNTTSEVKPYIVEFNDKLSKSSQKNNLLQSQNLKCDLIDDLNATTTLPSLENEETKCIKQPQQEVNIISSFVKENSPKLCTKNPQKVLELILDETKICRASSEFESSKLGIKYKSKKVSSDEKPTKRNQFRNLINDQLDQTYNRCLNLSPTMKFEENKKKTKSKDVIVHSFNDPLSYDLSKECFPSFSPLGSFEAKFDDNFRFKDNYTNDHISLINFESPVQETKNKSKDVDTEQNFKTTEKMIHSVAPLRTTTETAEEKIKKLTEIKTAVKKPDEDCFFATYDTIQSNKKDKNYSDATKQSSSVKPVSYKHHSKHSNFKELNKIDEKYVNLSNSFHKHNALTSSSEETEECVTIMHEMKISVHHHEKLTDDDEELRPLISGENFACSIVSSSSITEKNKVENDDNEPNQDEIDFEKRKNFSEKSLDNTEMFKNVRSNSEIDSDLVLNHLKERLSVPTKVNTKYEENDENNVDNVIKQHLINFSANNNCCECTQTNSKKKFKKKKR